MIDQQAHRRILLVTKGRLQIGYLIVSPQREPVHGSDKEWTTTSPLVD
ncbi:MAG: hypothetical protein ACRERV_13070 [Methylococcales bacterium]